MGLTACSPVFLFMDPTDTFLEAPPEEQEIIQPTDTSESTATVITDLFPNYAEKDAIVEEAKKRIGSLFSNIKDRNELEEIWEKNDVMFRVKPDTGKDDVHRANESSGVFHISVNQLVSMAFKTFTDNPENYKYGFRGIIDDEAANQIRGKNAEIMTQLFRKAQAQGEFKRNLKRILLDLYKNGNGFAGVPWEKQIVDVVYRDKETGERKTKPFTKNNLPVLDVLPLDTVWLDENIDEMDAQPFIGIKAPISWTKLLSDSKKNNVALFKDDEEGGLREKFAKYQEHVSSNEYNNTKSDRMNNADRTYEDRTGERYNHWVIWVNLPIDKKAEKWDENGPELRCRVRILGSPESCEIIEIRENIFPGGVPILDAHQTEDDIGMYHISLGEKIETYFDQVCIATDQLIDNRSKNLRRPVVYDPMRVEIDKYDFGHENTIPCSGDVRSGLFELAISDMTATIMPTIQYCEQKIREIMNTTDAVIGQAMGGRTSASEYMGAKMAATTPIFSDMASIEDDLIGGFMRRFSMYVHTFMTHEDLVEQLGPIGAEFTFDLADIYTVALKGVSEAMDAATKVQNLLQLYGLTQDAGAKAKIMLRIASAMGVENPAEVVSIPAKDQAIKAALWENNEMLIYGQWDNPEPGEMHGVHNPIHRQALWQAQRDKNPNAQMMQQHIGIHDQLERSEQVQGGAGSYPGGGLTGNDQSSLANPPPTLGEESGQQISAPMGSQNAGSPIPA